jgi:hypothetical protein
LNAGSDVAIHAPKAFGVEHFKLLYVFGSGTLPSSLWPQTLHRTSPPVNAGPGSLYKTIQGAEKQHPIFQDVGFLGGLCWIFAEVGARHPLRELLVSSHFLPEIPFR